MALTTQTAAMTNSHAIDSTPEYEVRLDAEGKGYLAKKKKAVSIDEIKSIVLEPKSKDKSKKKKIKRRKK